MAGATEGNTDIQYLDPLVPALIALIAGLVIHSFIIGVNVTDWWKGRSVTPVDHIVTSLAISRMGAQCVNTLYSYVDELFLRHLDSPVTLVIMNVIYDFFAYTNTLLTSLLSIVLCLKISNFHSRLFLYLRGMIVPRTVYFIGAAVLLSAFTCFNFLFVTITKATKDGTYYTTMNNSSLDCTSINYIRNHIIGSFFPFLFYYISSVLLFTSLYHHTTKMKMSSNLSVNLETYYSVMKYVFFTFIYNTVYFIVEVVCVYHYFAYCVYLIWLYTVFDFLPVLHSSYLIYRTAKLRSQMSKALQNIIDFLFQRKDTETRESIEVVAL
ncbi:hypothetical protein GDO78_013956 [Eleutherodactylus coqui]|uniref:Taste receptor type 2 n=1 Tax=Eleutherodactylus coqui TaxID=57060 RepID=A0A8J6E924_ELECQ|nr:hypothetical protein GDO78_013956 [Eleutherodactylus coqui]